MLISAMYHIIFVDYLSIHHWQLEETKFSGFELLHLWGAGARDVPFGVGYN